MLQHFLRISKNPLLLFLVKATSLYLIWVFCYDLWINPNQTIDLFVIDQLIDQGRFALKILGYDLIPDTVYDTEYRTLGLDGTHGVWIETRATG